LLERFFVWTIFKAELCQDHLVILENKAPSLLERFLLILFSILEKFEMAKHHYNYDQKCGYIFHGFTPKRINFF